MLHLLATRRFAPLFVTQFLGAFNDNLYKTAMLFLITYHLMGDDLRAGATLVMLAGGVFILPFFLFSGLAGQLADARDKAWIIRMVKSAEIVIMIVGALALLSDSVALLMLVLFAMGTHSAFFGPVKYAILPQHLAPAEVLAGTGLVEAGTFVAILTGQIMGGLLPPAWAAGAVLLVAAAGWISGRAVPAAPPLGAVTDVTLNPFHSTKAVLRDLYAAPRLWRAVLAISWFWALGAVLTSQFVPLVKGVLHADASVATLFLAMFSIGIAVGSLLVNRLLRGQVTTRLSVLSALAISGFLVELYMAFQSFPRSHVATMQGILVFFSVPGSYRIVFDLFCLAIAAGVFVVPLYAVLQTEVQPESRARRIAGNNIINAAFMVASVLVVVALLAAGLQLVHLFLVMAIMNIGAAGVLRYAGHGRACPRSQP